jgi:cystathionine gamma-synthase
MTPKHHLETRAAHLEPSQVAAEISPLLRTSTTYRRAPNNQLMDPANVYGRDQNDTVRQAEAVLAQMESAAAALLWPSGMAAISAVFRILPIGSRIVVQTGIYWGTTFWVRQFCEEQGHELVEVDAANGSDLDRISAFDPALVFVETPSNPWLKVVDIADMRRRFPNAYLVVDSTAATPALTRPLELGADLVVHSATKALNGHSDVIAGVTLTAQLDDRWARLAQHRATGGAIIGPFEAWLLLRSLRTFPLRLGAMCDNALRLATYLLNHPLVEDVFYPGLPSSPYHAIATQQMQGGYGYLMSVLVRGDRQTALDVLGRLQVFQRATSLGGVESLVEHRHTIEPHTGIPENLLRLSIGIEHIDDLIADMDHALRGRSDA